MNFSKQLSIKNRFFIGAIVFIVMMFATGAISYRYLHRVYNLALLNSSIGELKINIQTIRQTQNDFILKDYANAVFFKTGQSETIDEYNNRYNQAQEGLLKLSNNQIVIDHKLQKRFNIISNDIDTYDLVFKELVQKIKEKGFWAYGLLGNMHQSIDKIGLLLKKIPNNEILKNKLAEIEKNEKNFLMRKQLAYQRNQLVEIDNLLNLLPPANVLSEFDAETREKLIEEIAVYKSQFELLVDIETKIGLDYDEGLLAQAKAISNTILHDINDVERITTQKNKGLVTDSIYIELLFIFIVLIIILLMSFYFVRSLLNPLSKMNFYVAQLVEGNLPAHIQTFFEDEISAIAKHLIFLTDSLRTKTNFSKNIGKGNIDIDFTPLSENDELGIALVEMRNNLRKVNEESKQRQEEEAKLNWKTHGIAKFGDILRRHSDNIEQLAYEVISNLVKYLDANQGGLFIYDDKNPDDIHLNLLASYAFHRRKFIEKRIDLGAGLVGVCAIEKRKIYLKELPENYIHITSGLGDAEPKSLLIVPLNLDNEILGVLEIASFEEFKEHEIIFTEELAETIAATLATVKINAHTAKLLEESRLKSDEMSKKENALRKSLEELQFAQKEAKQKEERFHALFNGSYDAILILENGKFVDCNDATLRMLGYQTKEEVLNLHPSKLSPEFQPDGRRSDEKANEMIQKALETGSNLFEWEHIKADGSGFPVEVRLTTFVIDGNQIIHTLWRDLTEQKAAEEEILLKNKHTEELLKKSQEQTELLSNQEKAMKETMLEMTQIQEKLIEQENEKEEQIEQLQAENEQRFLVMRMAKEETEKNEYRFRAILNAVATALIAIDSQGKIDGVNSRFLNISAWNEPNVINKNITFLFKTFDLEKIELNKRFSTILTGKNRQMPVELLVSKVANSSDVSYLLQFTEI